MPACTLTSKLRPPEGTRRAEGACTQASLDSSTNLSSMLSRVLTASASCRRYASATCRMLQRKLGDSKRNGRERIVAPYLPGWKKLEHSPCQKALQSCCLLPPPPASRKVPCQMRHEVVLSWPPLKSCALLAEETLSWPRSSLQAQLGMHDLQLYTSVDLHKALQL